MKEGNASQNGMGGEKIPRENSSLPLEGGQEAGLQLKTVEEKMAVKIEEGITEKIRKGSRACVNSATSGNRHRSRRGEKGSKGGMKRAVVVPYQ